MEQLSFQGWTPTVGQWKLKVRPFFFALAETTTTFTKDMGILVMRGRLMTDDFKLRPRAEKWIKAIKSMYKAVDYIPTPAKPQATEIGGFKMM